MNAETQKEDAKEHVASSKQMTSVSLAVCIARSVGGQWHGVCSSWQFSGRLSHCQHAVLGKSHEDEFVEKNTLNAMNRIRIPLAPNICLIDSQGYMNQYKAPKIQPYSPFVPHHSYIT